MALGRGAWLRCALRASVALGLALAPAGAQAASWTPVTGATGIINQIARVRSADGTLHVVWRRDTPGSTSTADIVHAAIGPSGAVGAQSLIASGFASAGNPAIVQTPGGGLTAFFGGIQCTAPTCPSGLFTSSSSDGGRTWSTPTALFDRNSVYGEDMNAATLSDGTPFEAWWGTLGVFVHRGTDATSPDYNYQSAIGAGCCGYQANLAADGSGQLRLAWDSNATGFEGVWSQLVDPGTGAPSGGAALMPGSVTQYNGAPSHAQMLSRTPIVAQPGQAGQFWVAYPGGYPSTTKVLLWHVGSPTSLAAVSEPGDHDPVSLAADRAGRLWVFWAHSAGSGPHVFARRFGLAGFEGVIDLGAPAGAQSIYALDGEVDAAGDPEALALAGFANGSPGTYYTRGPQLAPPQNGKSVDLAPVSGIVRVKLRGRQSFGVLGSGAQIPVGSTVDATHGRVRLTAARAGRGGTQTADFYSGAFVVGQRPGKALTTLTLALGNSRACRAAADRATAAAAPTRRRFRYLWGSGSGSFTTTGRYAAATVRGTIWLTEDDCGGTLVKVKRGAVSVRDLVRHRTITVRAGHSYFAAR